MIFFYFPHVAPEKDVSVLPPSNPCIPNPCGLHSNCQPFNDYPSCSCLPTFFGSPPNCRPECNNNFDCPNTKACIRDRCADPCPGVCGMSAHCTVHNHQPICTCLDGYIGDAFTRCDPRPVQCNFFRIP